MCPYADPGRAASSDLPPAVTAIPLTRCRARRRHPRNGTHLDREPPVLVRPHVHPRHRARHPRRRDGARDRRRRGEHEPQVSFPPVASIFSSALTPIFVLPVCCSPRPTPEVATAVSEHPQAYDCMQANMHTPSTHPLAS